MKSWKRYIPEGTSDYLFQEAKMKLDLEEKVRKVFIKRGYKDVITPTIEFYDVFNASGRIIEQESMFKLFDKSGRILVLRPDETAPIARVVGTKLNDLKGSVKICYISNVYRINERYNGKSSETTQAGIEIIGTQNVKADAEVIITGIKSLLSIGIDDFIIEIGHALFFNSIMDEILLNDEDKESIRELVENKNYTSLDEFIKNNSSIINNKIGNQLRMLPGLFGGFDILEHAEKSFDYAGAKKAIDDIKEVYSLIKAAGLDKYIKFDLGMVHELNYYTGIIFRGYSNYLGQDIISGGRYDGLVANFGNPTPSTGMAIYLDNILEINKKINKTEKTEEKIIIYFNKGCGKTAYTLCDFLDEKELKNEISLYEDYEATILHADETAAKYVACIYTDDNITLASGDGSEIYMKQTSLNDIFAFFNGGSYGISKDSTN